MGTIGVRFSIVRTVRHLLIVCAFAIVAISAAQSREIPGHLIAKPPTIDGLVNDDEWSGIPSVQGLVDEATDAPAPEGATFWIAYDQNFVYFAARLQDPNPSEIRATEYRTNVSLSGDDRVSINIDLSGSASDFNVFEVNPRGATSIELAGGRAAKREWTGEFFAKGRVTETGWEAEARIPWQILRLPGAGKRNLRVNFGRSVARTQRSYQYVNIEENNVGKCPMWLGVQVPNQVVAKSLKLLPYAYFGYEKSGHVFNSGLDLKTQLTDQIELVGTINPDFRNIENQVLSLDFSRFERLAGESRPFFQEGSEYLLNALFASQRIDSFDVGFNTYGRLSNKTSFGFLNITDWDRNNVLGSETTKGTRNNIVGSFTHNPDPTLLIRGAVTSVQRPDLSNDAYLLRISKELGDFTVSGRQMASKDSISGYGKYEDAFLEYSRNGWNSYLGYSRVDPNFNPRLGFFPDRDFKGLEYGTQYAKNFDHGFLNDWGFFFGGNSYRHVDNQPYRRELTINPYTTIRGGLAIVGEATLSEFEGSEDEFYRVSLGFPRGNPYRSASLTYGWGHQEGLPYESIAVSGAYRTLGRLQTNLRYQHVKLGGTQDQLIFSANYDLGKDRSIAGRMVRNSGDTNFYIALKQSGNLGTEYFLILGDPNAQTFQSSLILKVTVPFEVPLGRAKTAPPTMISGPGGPIQTSSIR